MDTSLVSVKKVHLLRKMALLSNSTPSSNVIISMYNYMYRAHASVSFEK